MRRLLSVTRSAIREAPGILWKAVCSLDSSMQFAADVRAREPMDDETFWVTSYKNAGVSFEIATTVRRVYGEQLGHDPQKLRAEDFDPQMLEIDTVEMIIEVEEALGISISDDEAEQTSGSIDSIIQLVARKLAGVPLAKVRSEGPAIGLAPARRTASSA